MKRLLSYSVVMFVITIILLLIIPLPAGLVDVAIILNMSLSMMILVITMTIREPLEFSIFPSLLLITTLFRLGINVSTTRNILSQGGSSGRVIAAFGDFVLRGNVVVGLIIFLIIVLMQFIVITKGAERVAEVAARFNLDAMPGKQMAIDADLSSGLINETQAKERRAKVQREADFYGAMDGATKIVKGDAVMSLITTAINLIGGSIIGIVQSGSSISAVLSTYSIATVGDGLVSQIPALLISTATGMIVTRAVSEGSLNEDVSKQFLAQPHAMIVSGAAVAVMAVIPGMPAVRTLVVAACLMGSGFYLSGKIKKEPQALSQMAMAPSTQLQDSPQAQAAAAKEEVSEEEYFKDVNNVYSLLTLEPVEIEFGYSLIPLADESVGGRLISRIVIFRRQYAQDMGFVIPSIRLRDSSSLGPSQYSIRIKGEEIAGGEILIDYFLALEPEEVEEEIEGIEAIEPAYGIPSRWIKPENRDRAELYDRINRRVDQMISDGLEDEIRSLMSMGLSSSDISMKGIGYKEMIDAMNGRITMEEATELIKRNSRRYAKRQMTWFRRYPDIRWFDLSENSEMTCDAGAACSAERGGSEEEILSLILSYIREQSESFR